MSMIITGSGGSVVLPEPDPSWSKVSNARQEIRTSRGGETRVYQRPSTFYQYDLTWTNIRVQEVQRLESVIRASGGQRVEASISSGSLISSGFLGQDPLSFQTEGNSFTDHYSQEFGTLTLKFIGT